jgi:hypothetical protein
MQGQISVGDLGQNYSGSNMVAPLAASNRDSGRPAPKGQIGYLDGHLRGPWPKEWG